MAPVIETPLFQPCVKMHRAWVNEKGRVRFVQLMRQRFLDAGSPTPDEDDVQEGVERLKQAWVTNGWKQEWMTLRIPPQIVTDIADSLARKKIDFEMAGAQRKRWLEREGWNGQAYLIPPSRKEKKEEITSLPMVGMGNMYTDFLLSQKRLEHELNF